ncbi:MAG: PemK-like protein [Ignavibacteria bacterium]|nr:PemK-like protein [Ignavibacteria bacterium]
MVDIHRGDVVLCDLCEKAGTDPSGLRQALIVQSDKANTASPFTVIIPFTINIPYAALPSHVLIQTEQTGLTQDSVLLCEQIRVLDKKRIVKVSGHLSNYSIEQVNRALATVLGL